MSSFEAMQQTLRPPVVRKYSSPQHDYEILSNNICLDDADAANKNSIKLADIEIKFYEDIAQVDKMWQEFQQNSIYTVFQELTWVKAWLDVNKQNKNIRPLFVLIYENGALSMIMPLVRKNNGNKVGLYWQANEISDYNGALWSKRFLEKLDQTIIDFIWNTIRNYDGSIDYCHLDRQPQNYNGMVNQFCASDVLLSSCASHGLKLQKDWSHFYGQLRSSSARKRVRQKLNKLNRLGKVDFRCVKGLGAQLVILDQILQWKSEQLNMNGDRNPFTKLPFKEVLYDVLKHQNESSGQPVYRIYGLFVDGKLIAGKIVMVKKECFSLFVTAYDANFKPNCSPGLILLIKTMELASRAGIQYYDFMAGDEGYKAQWCDTKLILSDSFAAFSWRGKLHISMAKIKLSLKKRIKSSTMVITLLKRVNYTIHG